MCVQMLVLTGGEKTKRIKEQLRLKDRNMIAWN